MNYYFCQCSDYIDFECSVFSRHTPEDNEIPIHCDGITNDNPELFYTTSMKEEVSLDPMLNFDWIDYF